MTEKNTPATETDSNENPDTPSDARVILGPLVKYAAMGFVLVGIIITTAVMMDRQLNDIDQEVAELEAELAQANSSQETEMTATAQKPASPEVNTAAHQQAPAVAKPAESTVAAQPQPAASVAENKVDATPAAEEKTAHETTVETPVVTASVAAHAFAGPIAETNDDFYVQPMDEIIAERNAYLKEKDLEYLESFRASQEKKLESMRERLARQEQRIKEMESRYQEIYDIRAADMKEMQERRESFLTDRI
ncbi:MAG: hypothetical protein PVF35_03415 [Gammaproteobacteria bacterium]|jgi:hypothetical protein